MAPCSTKNILWPLLLTMIVASGCAGNKAPEPLPSQTTTQVTPQLEPPPDLPPPIREVAPTRASTIKVIDPGGDDDQPKTLLEASKRAKAEKEKTGEPVAEITDENLHEYAEGGEVIILTDEPAADPLKLEPEPLPEDPGDPRDEGYWRNRAMELRMSWRRAVDEIAELELEAAALRQQFYAEEELYIRDGQIKPAWDRVLDRLGILRQRSQLYEKELDLFVEDGRRSGVPQGWLNEGWELEPSDEEKERVNRFDTYDPEQDLTDHQPQDVSTGSGGDS